MEQLGSKMGGKVADARKGDARRVPAGIAGRCAAVARAGLTTLALAFALAFALVAAACGGGTAPTLPDPGPSGLSFTFKSQPPGASVTVDGVSVGPTPATVKLRPGPHRVRASMSGYYPAPETRVQVGATEPAELTLHLVASH